VNELHGLLETGPVFLGDEVWVDPFGEVIGDQIDRRLGRSVDSLIGEACCEGINRLNWRWDLALSRVHDKIRVAHLTLALPLGNFARNDAVLADRVLGLQPPRVGPKIGDRQEAGAVEQKDPGRRAIIIRGFDGVNLAFHRGDFFGHEVIETVARAPVEPTFRHMQQQVPDRLAIYQSFEHRF